MDGGSNEWPNVFRLVGGGIAADGTYDDALATFAHALAREVREGKIVGIVGVLFEKHEDGSIGIVNGWCGDIGGEIGAYEAIGAVRVLERELMDDLIEGLK